LKAGFFICFLAAGSSFTAAEAFFFAALFFTGGFLAVFFGADFLRADFFVAPARFFAPLPVELRRLAME
jgi:hypothetical protein